MPAGWAPIKILLEARGLGCTIVDYPPDFRSRDSRETPANAIIDVPASG